MKISIWPLWLLCILAWGGSNICAQIPAADQPALAAPPTDAALSAARVFDEPLVPTSASSNPQENQALSDALAAYSHRTTADDCSSLANFADTFPQSRWTASLLLHLGVEYYNYGYFSRALDAWQRAWAQYETNDYPPAKAQGDRALGELARMHARLGHIGELSALLDSTKDRDVGGPGHQLLQATTMALWTMKNRPDFSFGCGPSALDRILQHFAPAKAGSSLLLECKSGTNGFSLSQVAEISRKLGMNYQMAYRPAGAPLVLPSVIHWKLGHYAAVIERRDNLVLVQDYTFVSSLWVSQKALDEEASGYFLVPPGNLPAGWRPVSAVEGDTVWGKGPTFGQVADGTDCIDTSRGGTRCQSCNPCPGSAGMTTYSMHALLVSLTLEDTPMDFFTPLGPEVDFTATYNQLEANQPAGFYYSNLGPKWDCNWVSFVADNPTTPNADVYIYDEEGGTLRFSNFDPVSQAYAIEPMTQALLVRLTSSSYELRYPDGSKREYVQSDGSTGTTRRTFMTAISDPAGSAVAINYDAQLHITNIVNAIGQATTLAYTNPAYPFAITSVTDPFGRTASFLYNADGTLAQITDTLGLVSQYTYGANQFVTALTTPYGTTTFATGITNGNDYLTATDPLGGTEAMEYSQSLPVPTSLPASEVPHGLSTFNLYLDARDSFYWSKKAFAQNGWDWSKAEILHWLHQSPNGSQSSRILESEKDPLESRIWYNYPGEYTNLGAPYYLDAAYTGASAAPSIAARVLDDGTTQLSAYGRNALGYVTNYTDPMGRSFMFLYSTNNIDLLEGRMTHNGKNELVSSATYNAQYMPLTLRDEAGQTTAVAYDARGQILTLSDPENRTVTFGYDTNGFLVSAQGPLAGSNDTAILTYDSTNRIHTLTDTEGYTITVSYDVFDRPVLRSYPDGTTEQFVYNLLDLVATKDRMGRWTTNTFDANRHLISIRDPLGRVTRFEWCPCGLLESIIDPLGRQTSWTYDIEGRAIAKQFPDGSMETYGYDGAGRLNVFTDANGLQTTTEYYPDDSVKSISYIGGTNATPSVQYAYDPDYDRLVTMQDGVGTTVYAYNPITPAPALGAGQLQSISGPLPDSTVSYTYDALGQPASRSINGVVESGSYDVLGRITNVVNSLGTFQYSYLDATPRVAAASCPNGQTSLYSYHDVTQDQRLKQILNLKPGGALLSSFGYAYNAAGQITALTNTWDTMPARVWQYGYDAIDELIGAVRTDGVQPLSTNSYTYDFAGNRTLGATATATNNLSYNAMNEIVNGASSLTNGETCEWDAARRLVAINSGAHRTEFTYDGLDRRTRIVEKEDGVVVANNTFLWCDNELCEERDATGTVVLRRFFPQGEAVIGAGTTNLFYTRDHLGSVREALDGSGALQARYDYDPYGQQTVVDENIATTFGFAGHFQHRPSGLYLAKYRGLDPTLGRWLNRDPAGESGGLNMYAYVDNNPVKNVDELGLCGQTRNQVLEKAFHNAYSANEEIRFTSLLNAAREAEAAEKQGEAAAAAWWAKKSIEASLKTPIAVSSLPKPNTLGGGLSYAGAALSTYNNVSDDLKNGAGAANTAVDGGATAISSVLVSANPLASTLNLVTAGGAGALVNNGLNGPILLAKTAASGRVNGQQQAAIKKIMTRNWLTCAIWKVGEKLANVIVSDPDPCEGRR